VAQKHVDQMLKVYKEGWDDPATNDNPLDYWINYDKAAALALPDNLEIFHTDKYDGVTWMDIPDDHAKPTFQHDGLTFFCVDDGEHALYFTFKEVANEAS
jgi:hypothetical protein